MRLFIAAIVLLQRVTADFTLYAPNAAPCADPAYANQLALKADNYDNLAGAFTVDGGAGAPQVFNVSLWVNVIAPLQLSSLSISIFADMVDDYVSPPGPQKNSQPCVQPPYPPPPPAGGYPDFPAGVTPCSPTCTGGSLVTTTETANAKFLTAQLSASGGGGCILFGQNVQYWVVLSSSDTANQAFICGLQSVPPDATQVGGAYKTASALVSKNKIQWDVSAAPPWIPGSTAVLGFSVNAPAPAASASPTPSVTVTSSPTATPSASATASLAASASWSGTAAPTPSHTPTVSPSSTGTPSRTPSPSRTATPPQTGTTSPSPTNAQFTAATSAPSSGVIAGIVVPIVLFLALIAAACAAPALVGAAIAVCLREVCRRKGKLTQQQRQSTVIRPRSSAAMAGGGGGDASRNTYADIMRAREALARQTVGGGGGFTGPPSGGALV